MNGGGGGDMISLEDLESVSEDQLSDSPEEELDDQEDQERLLRYWRDVARGHQVEVPRGKHTHTHARARTHTHTHTASKQTTPRSDRSRQFNGHSPQQRD